MDVLEEQVLEERDLDLNKEEYISIEVSIEENWKYVAEFGKDMNNMHDLRWDVYKK